MRPNSPHITVTTSSCHAAVVQVLDQVGDAAVDLRQLLLQRLEVLAVRVPAADGQRHAADAGLDQPAGGQELLDALVALARLRRLPCFRSRALRTTPAVTISMARSV